jgi:hypothetical protein
MLTICISAMRRHQSSALCFTNFDDCALNAHRNTREILSQGSKFYCSLEASLRSVAMMPERTIARYARPLRQAESKGECIEITRYVPLARVAATKLYDTACLNLDGKKYAMAVQTILLSAMVTWMINAFMLIVYTNLWQPRI